MLTVRLPELPEGKEFEELVSAVFQSAGFYVERNIIERGKEELLELDIVLTNYRSDPCPQTTLVEAKAKGWGFGDVFKLRGWMCYLDLERGYFIAHEKPDHLDFFAGKAKEVGVELFVIEDLKEAPVALSPLTGTPSADDIDVAAWRFSYWAERRLLASLTELKKSVADKKCYRALDRYYFRVNSGIFFEPTVLDRLRSLYEAFHEYPHISAKIGHELEGEDFDQEHGTIPEALFKQTYWASEYTPIQVSAFVEHRARLAILKNAVDYELLKRVGTDNGARMIKIGDKTIEFSLFDILPGSFKEGLEQIREDEWFARYPVFWQWFLWLFGGFILLDYEAQEYALLAEKTGIPVESIDRALDVYDLLFPHAGGWFGKTGTANIKFLKLFSVPFMGVGANYRRLRYTDDGKYESLELGGQYTLSDLVHWNNLLVEVLASRQQFHGYP